MKRHTKIALAAAVAVIGIGALGSAVVAQGQHRGYGPGYGPGYGMQHANMMGGMQGQGMYGRGMQGHGMSGQGMMGNMGNRFQMMEQKFETHDLDGDGAVSQAEIDQFRQDRLKTYDENKDGKLELSEFEKLWLNSKRNRMVDRFQAFDNDGDGKVTDDEFRTPMGRMIERHDRDGDGKVTLSEMRNHPRGRGPGRYYNDDDANKRDKD